ncbi:Orn/DAP/Arg decarboxylase 2 [Segniliparus rotundus DSM 44985]|uniref:Orn/DAP/Arg decarboxylase 2 n=1 Tax=Segniliparus rotundus (strain ATCC BAA-972 / CDC 1076 / CIP 108378 / DSM 44985 / JCM 13578) TaxID=640132 RepID=D6ZFK2_SEGRD|nr:decarboxylase [Segniliparus rotundus]ADG97726.1 Orn/DAP/Arg decarboxylase 2 [Segniliparus rotundus DSM 44985]
MTLLELCPSLRAAARPRFDHRLWPATLHCDEEGRPLVGGVALTDLADQFGTACDIVDEAEVRAHATAYQAALPNGEIAYSSRALLAPAIASWLAEEGLSLDVGSADELAVALRGGFPASRIIAGGAVKTREELAAALAAGVGRISVDTFDELAWLASRIEKPQQILLRVGLSEELEQAFGFPLSSLAEEAWLRAHRQKNLRVVGLHCHVGSGSHEQALAVLLDFLEHMRSAHGLEAQQLNLGGGVSVETAQALAVERAAQPLPRLIVEPGQGVVGQAGTRLVRVIAKNFGTSGEPCAHVDGPLPISGAVPPSCTGADLDEVRVVNRHSLAADVPTRLLSRPRAESHGPADAARVPLPADLRAGDLLAFPGCGAYHHAHFGALALIGVRDGRADRLA